MLDIKELIAEGLIPTDAEELVNQFDKESDFMLGLKQISEAMAFRKLGTDVPTGEPWKTIYTSMKNSIDAGMDVDSAYSVSMGGFDSGLQDSITRAVSVCMGNALDNQKTAGKTSKGHKTIDYINQLKQLGYSFRLNVCTTRVEVNGVRINDFIKDDLWNKMRDAGFASKFELEAVYSAEAWKNSYHPIKEYLESLSYDGGSYIAEVASHFTDKYSVFGLWLRKWMIGACAKVYEAEQNPMLIIDGAQHMGKSEFVKWLAGMFKPDKGLSKYFMEGSIDPDKKDTDVRLMDQWIWEVCEMGSTVRKADVEALKAFLTKRSINVRKAYDRYETIRPAMASFIGTFNNVAGILNDPTGSRRFHISHITKIDWAYRQLNPDLAWGEAMAAYRMGEDWNLTPDEEKISNKINNDYQLVDPVEDLLNEYFMIDNNHLDWWVSSNDILDVMEANGFRGNRRGAAMQLASTMCRLDCQKKRQRNAHSNLVNGYTGIKVI